MRVVESSIAALAVLISGVLLADPLAPKHTDRMNEMLDVQQSVNNGGPSENPEDWPEGGEELSLEKEVVADNRGPPGGHRNREHPAVGGGHEDCCPSQMEMIEPNGGRNPDGLYVELYGDGADKQRFYEVSCKPGVEGKPCSFLERRLRRSSTCVQRYSYSYAIVHGGNSVARRRRHGHGTSSGQYSANNNGTGGRLTFLSLFPGDNVWKLDYIKVRSGCTCTVQPRNKTQQKHRRKKGIGGAGSGTGGGGGSGGGGGGGGGGGKRSQQFRAITIGDDNYK